MYFEDEKGNMKDDNLDDLALDLDDDGDDKSITWDDLLNDDADLDLDDVKKTSDSDLLSMDDDLSLLDDNSGLEDGDDLLGVAPAAPPARKARNAQAPAKDAFEVFGADTEILAQDSGTDSFQPQAPDDSDSGDAFTPDLTRARESARTKASPKREENDDDDDIYFEPQSAKKSSGFPVMLLAFLVALLVVGVGAYLFLTFGKPVGDVDTANMLNPASQQEQLADNQAPPSIDPNDPASAFDLNKADDAAKAKDDAAQKKEDKNAEKKAEKKVVTFDVQNAGRINPFLPPLGFESAKISTSDYELLSPPEGLPDAEFTKEAEKLMNVTVSGILYDDVKPSAIVNMNNTDYFVQVGDMVDDFQIIAINKNYVAIKNGTNIYKAQVGESFNNNLPAGMATRQTSGAKHYISSSEVEVSVKEN